MDGAGCTRGLVRVRAAAYPDLLDRLQLRLFRREADQDDRPEDAEGAPHGAASVQRLTQEAVGKDC